MSSDAPAVNGYAYTYSSIEISIAGDISDLVKEIKYTLGRDRGTGRGTSGKKRLRGRGDDEPEGSIVFYRRGFDELIERLGDGWMDIELNFVVSMADDGQPTKSDRLTRVLISKAEAGGSEGTDLLEVSCDLDIMEIQFGPKKARAS